MSGADREPDGILRCTVCYALPERQQLWEVELRPGATIADAIGAARARALAHDPVQAARVPWDTAPTGVFGEARTRGAGVEQGDRVELYRPLSADPREQRRERVRQSGRTDRGSK